MTEQYIPTTEQVRLDYVMAYSEKESSQILAERDFDRWLAERDAEVAAKAWALCDATITEHLVGNTAITAAIASGWPENPYRKAVEQDD